MLLQEFRRKIDLEIGDERENGIEFVRSRPARPWREAAGRAGAPAQSGRRRLRSRRSRRGRRRSARASAEAPAAAASGSSAASASTNARGASRALHKASASARRTRTEGSSSSAGHRQHRFGARRTLVDRNRDRRVRARSPLAPAYPRRRIAPRLEIDALCRAWRRTAPVAARSSEGWRSCRPPSPVMAVDADRADCTRMVKINLKL